MKIEIGKKYTLRNGTVVEATSMTENLAYLKGGGLTFAVNRDSGIISSNIQSKYDVVSLFEPEEKYVSVLNQSKMQDIPNGLYCVQWISGGSSYAAIGRDSSGRIWISFCNWVSGQSWLDEHINDISYIAYIVGNK